MCILQWSCRPVQVQLIYTVFPGLSAVSRRVAAELNIEFLDEDVMMPPVLADALAWQGCEEQLPAGHGRRGPDEVHVPC